MLIGTACGPGGVGTEGSDTSGTETETDGGETTTTTTGGEELFGWAEAVCLDLSNGPTAMVRAEGLGDAWLYALHVSELDAREQGGEILRRVDDDWGDDSCADGVKPNTGLLETRCYMTMGANMTSICYVGDGEWFGAVLPACDQGLQDLDANFAAWAEWTCAGGTEAIADPWVRISCTENEPGACIAWAENEGAITRPPCWQDSYPELSLIDCEVGAPMPDPCVEHPGALGCGCEAGGCVENLVCGLQEVCTPCPPGSPGCRCAVDEFCEEGVCSSGTDDDGTSWSICVLGGDVVCSESPCPGDAICTDAETCAWPD